MARRGRREGTNPRCTPSRINVMRSWSSLLTLMRSSVPSKVVGGTSERSASIPASERGRVEGGRGKGGGQRERRGEKETGAGCGAGQQATTDDGEERKCETWEERTKPRPGPAAGAPRNPLLPSTLT